MFNFKELAKLKDFNFLEDLTCSPKGNKGIYTEDEYNNAMTGAAICVGASILSAIVGILLVLGLLELFMALPIGDTDISVSIDVLMILVLICTHLNKGKAHNSWLEYIMFIIVGLGIFGNLFSMLALVIIFAASPVYALLMFVLFGIDIVGRLFIVVSYLGFAKRIRKEYDQAHMVMPTGVMTNPDGTPVQVQTWAPQQPQVQQQKTCPYCGNAVSAEAKFCKTCGASVE